MAPRILIAEDDELQSAVLRSALQSRGYETDVATDGLEAVRRLRTEHYDVALLDYNMPEIDGLGAARLLHDLMPESERPRLIAVTATAEGLHEKGDTCLDASFDAIVSKRVGMPALFSIIESNLTVVAERHAAITIARHHQTARDAKATRRQRWLGVLAALPAAGMVCAFTAALGLGTSSLQDVDAALGSTRHADTVSTGTAALIGTMQDAENSQRTFLATGAEADHARFETDAQHVDRLLSSAIPLSAGGTPGFDQAGVPQAVIEPRLRTLATEADARAAGPNPPGVSAEGGRDAADHLRSWAAGLMSGALAAVSTGLGAVRHNVTLILAVLGAGMVYSLWNAGRILHRQWRRAPKPAPARPDVLFRPFKAAPALPRRPALLLTDS